MDNLIQQQEQLPYRLSTLSGLACSRGPQQLRLILQGTHDVNQPGNKKVA